MQFSIAFVFTVLAAAVSAAPAVTPANPLIEERACVPRGGVCKEKDDCCSGYCFFGDRPSDPYHCS